MALGIIGDTRAVVPLIDALKDDFLYVRVDTARALSKIAVEDFGDDQVKWQSWWEENKEKYIKE